MIKKKIRIGCGAGFAGDRLEPAMVLVEKGELDYLVLECLAERTIALAQRRKRSDPTKGYDLLLERRMKMLLPLLHRRRVRLITNMGAANPLGAAMKIIEIARQQELQLSVAVVLGDDVFSMLTGDEITMETGVAVKRAGKLISANAYLGSVPLVEALESGADIVVTGRVADPSLFVAAMVYELGWDLDDAHRIGQATVIGHLMECAGQLTGGYFADEAYKPVTRLADLGHPFVDVYQDGEAVISKVHGTGGVISVATAKEQLLYEVINPYAYITPDVVADFSQVNLQQLGLDEVAVSGGRGSHRPNDVKVSVGYEAGYVGEGEISYAGFNALGRARLAADILRNRLGDDFTEIRIDYIGQNSLHRTDFSHATEPYEIRLRVAARTMDLHLAQRLGEEVEALYTNGPAGGGGVRKYVQELVGIQSVLMDRTTIDTRIKLFKT